MVQELDKDGEYILIEDEWRPFSGEIPDAYCVEDTFYGCDTGCVGYHVTEVPAGSKDLVWHDRVGCFFWEYQEAVDYAKELAKDNGRQILRRKVDLF